MAKVEAMIVFEMLGRPPEHLEKTMKEFVEKVGAEKGMQLRSKKIHEVKEMEKVKGIYSTFAELEIEFDDIMELMRILFTYMPSHVEIYSPENMGLSNLDANTLFNELLKRLHLYDDIAKRLKINEGILENRIKELSSGSKKEIAGKPEEAENRKPEEAKPEPEEANKEAKVEEPKKKGRKKKAD